MLVMKGYNALNKKIDLLLNSGWPWTLALPA